MNKDIYQTLLHEWLDKTEWVQKTAQPLELGLHRADVIFNRFRELKAQRDLLLNALKKIEAIEDKMFGLDWEEIEEARTFARDTIKLVENHK